MKIDVDKEDLIYLLKGVCVPMDFINEYSSNEYGYFRGGFSDEWTWDIGRLRTMTEEKLYGIFCEIKEHWSK